MNPGPVEEAAKTVGSFMDVMKTQPLSLALVVMNLALLGIFWAILSVIDKNTTLRESRMMEQEKHVLELMSKCVVPDKKTEAESEPIQLGTLR